MQAIAKYAVKWGDTMSETLKYETRDGKGNDIVKDVEIKRFESVPGDYECSVCGKQCGAAIPLKNIASGHFTDWSLIGEYVCEDCSRLFSLYKYSYIIDPDGIRLLNVRQVRNEILRRQKPPFQFVITKSQKKHLFYDAPMNFNADCFSVKLERETIATTHKRQIILFDFVEGLLALGASKVGMSQGEIPYDVLKKVGFRAQEFLIEALATGREIQIPLFCGQKREINEEEVLCNLDLILTAK